MESIIKHFKSIDWRRGNGMMIITATISVLIMVFVLIIMENNNIYTTAAIAQTRADVIADSAAVYSVTYDYEFNIREAYEMAALLTAYNNTEKTTIVTSAAVKEVAGKNSLIEVSVEAKNKFFFVEYEGNKNFSVKRDAAVRVVKPEAVLVIQ